MSRDPRSRHRSWLVGLVLAPIALVALGLWLQPDPRGHGTHEQLGLRACLAPEVLGIPCPGCGWTTSVSLTCHGRLGEAWLTHPMGPIAVALALGVAGWALVQHRRRRDLSLAVARVRWERWGPLLGIAFALSWAFEIWRWRESGA